jgi:hypothetical protein
MVLNKIHVYDNILLKNFPYLVRQNFLHSQKKKISKNCINFQNIES